MGSTISSVCSAAFQATRFLGAMRIDAFRSATEFKKDMDDWIGGFRNATPIAGQDKVIVPGDPEREAETERMLNGIPLLEAVQKDLISLGEKMKVPF